MQTRSQCGENGRAGGNAAGRTRTIVAQTNTRTTLMQRERQHSTKPRSALTALDAHAHAGTSVDDDDVGAERRRARDDDVLSVCRRSGRMARLSGRR